MNAVYESSLARRSADAVGTAVGVLAWGLLQGVRLVLFAVLTVCGPLVRAALSFLSLACFFTAGLYYFAGSPDLHVSYGILLSFAMGCALALALYEAVLRMLQP